VLFADFLPQDWLFARAACSIQHGGIGTIARALRAGCPILVEPFGNDQLYNASRVSLLGPAPRSSPSRPRRTASRGCSRRRSCPRPPANGPRGRCAHRRGARLAHACDLIGTFLGRPGREDPSRVLWRVPTLAETATAKAAPQAAAAPRAPDDPRVVHQGWRDAAVPEAVAGWRRSWQEQNPGWELRL